MVMLRFLVCTEIEVVCNDVDGEGHNGSAEAWQSASEHCPFSEDWMLAPNLILGPAIPKERSRHLSLVEFKLC